MKDIKYLALTSWLKVESIDIKSDLFKDCGSSYYCTKTFRNIYKEFLFDTEQEALDFCEKKLIEQVSKTQVKYLRAQANLNRFMKKYREEFK